MSLEEKIGQVFIVGFYSNKEDALKEGLYEDPLVYIERMIENHHIGGILFKQRLNPLEIHHYTGYFQSLSKIPLFMSIDAEWGLAMRMEKAPSFPKNQALGEIADVELIYQMGLEIGRELALLGINWNFSPVVDIYSNHKNPIIHDRSFGVDKEEVAIRASYMIQGLQASGIMACAKHFPGHGGACRDSHLYLPEINRTKEELLNLELYPFKKAIEAGVLSIMSAHLLIPSLDPEHPTSLSIKTIEELLKKEMGFKGLVVTDDLLMDAVAVKYEPGERACLAFLAGNDLILSSREIEAAVAAMKEAVMDGRIATDELDKRVAKVLDAKARLFPRGRKKHSPLIEKELFSEMTARLKQKLFQNSVHILRDPKKLLPLNLNENLKLVEISIKGFSPLYKRLVELGGVSYACLSKYPTEREKKVLFQILKENEKVIVAIRGLNRVFQDDFGASKETFQLIDDLIHQNKDVAVIIYGSPSIAENVHKDAAVILAYEEEPDVENCVFDLLFGKKKEEHSEGTLLPKERLTL